MITIAVILNFLAGAALFTYGIKKTRKKYRAYKDIVSKPTPKGRIKNRLKMESIGMRLMQDGDIPMIGTGFCQMAVGVIYFIRGF